MSDERGYQLLKLIKNIERDNFGDTSWRKIDKTNCYDMPEEELAMVGTTRRFVKCEGGFIYGRTEWPVND